MNIIQVYKQFPTNEDCLKHLEDVRWQGEPICPYCQSKKVTSAPKEKRHHCNNCNTSFSVTVRTIFHKTKLPLQKWFLAISLALNAKKGISARQLARDIEVNKNTAWSMMMRIREAMLDSGELLRGIIEVDESYIGGKDKNKHKSKRNGGRGRSTKTKTPVAGTLERGGTVRARKVKNVGSTSLKSVVYENVEKGATLVTDEWQSYVGLSKKFKHEVIKHKDGEYVNGKYHINTLEGFWALFKRGIMGQYHHITERHIDKYLKEFCFRYNNREAETAFKVVLAQAVK